MAEINRLSFNLDYLTQSNETASLKSEHAVEEWLAIDVLLNTVHDTFLPDWKFEPGYDPTHILKSTMCLNVGLRCKWFFRPFYIFFTELSFNEFEAASLWAF